jgi:hypothetical protein
LADGRDDRLRVQKITLDLWCSDHHSPVLAAVPRSTHLLEPGQVLVDPEAGQGCPCVGGRLSAPGGLIRIPHLPHIRQVTEPAP